MPNRNMLDHRRSLDGMSVKNRLVYGCLSHALLFPEAFYSVADVCGCRLDALFAVSGLSTRRAADRRAAAALSTSSGLCAAVTTSRRRAGSGLCPCSGHISGLLLQHPE